MNINHKMVFKTGPILKTTFFNHLFLLLLLLFLNKNMQAQESLTVLKIHDPVAVCYPATVDLTIAEITEGSTEGLKFNYYVDTELKIFLPDPKKAGAGTYYIKGTSATNRNTWVAGSVNVKVNKKPVMRIENSVFKGPSELFDLTSPTIKQGSDEGLIYSYWQDEAAAKSLPVPESVATGTFYIKGTSVNGCSEIQSITVINR